MILSIGIDVVEKFRIKNFYSSYKIRFLKRIFSNCECLKFLQKKRKIEFISRVFSAKESILKSFGCGLRNSFSFKKISIFNNILGKPYLKNFNNVNIFISISHEKNLTIVIIVIF